MADLRSEIEARKSRIAELKRQREALALNGLAPDSTARRPEPVASKDSKLSIVGLPGPQIEIEAPFIYHKSVQTERIIAEPETQAPALETVPRAEQKSDVEPIPENLSRFTIVESSAFPPSFTSFLDNSWRAVVRSGIHPPAVRDYTTTPTSQQDRKNIENYTLLRNPSELEHSNSLVSWSPHFDDLLVTRSSDPRQLLIWSTDAPDKPEFSLRSPTPVTAVVFSPHNAQYIYGGGGNGQLFAWNLKDRALSVGARLDLLPQFRSPIVNSKVLFLQFVGVNLVSLNEDGNLDIWSSDSLSKPRQTVSLEDKFRSSLSALKINSVVVPTCMAVFKDSDSAYGLGYGIGLCVIGSVQGQLFRLPAMPTTQPEPLLWGHEAPITCLAFRNSPASLGTEQVALESDGSRKRGSLLLSGALDWHLRVWYVPVPESEQPQLLLTLSIDYSVSDVCWHPSLPSVFLAVGEDQIQVWNLDKSTVKPVHTSNLDRVILKQIAFKGSKVAFASLSALNLFTLDESTLSCDGSWMNDAR